MFFLSGALAHHQRPVLGKAGFAALTPWGQAVTVFHHCLLGDQGRQVAGWMQAIDPAC